MRHSKSVVDENGHLDLMGKMDRGEPIYLDYRILSTDTHPEPMPAYSIGGVMVGTLENFSIITGKAKARKSFFVSAIVAACLSGEYGNITSHIKGRVLYVDTEQGVSHCDKILKRIVKASSCLNHEVDGKMVFLTLRELNTEGRLEKIEEAIYDQHKIGLEMVVIDGLRDLVFDINSPEESTKIIDKLMEWTAAFGIHIICVLHENKGNDQLRGHLGTEGQNKAEAVIQVEKIDERASKVEPKFTRNKDFAPFAFQINDEGLPIPSELKGKETPLEFDLGLIKGIAGGAFREREVYESKSIFNTAVRKFYYECTKKTIGEKKAYKLIEVMEAEGIIHVTTINARKIEIRKGTIKLA